MRGRERLQGGAACKEILGLREPWWGKRSWGDQRDQRGRAWIRRLDLRRRVVDSAYMGGDEHGFAACSGGGKTSGIRGDERGFAVWT